MIYVASSWRNLHQPKVVETLRSAGADVYDFRHPVEGNDGFDWSEIDPDWQSWTFRKFRKVLRESGIATAGYGLDKAALDDSSRCVLVLPCGRSEHLEAGLMCGRGLPVAIYSPPGVVAEPELMYAMCDALLTGLGELVDWAVGPAAD